MATDFYRIVTGVICSVCMRGSNAARNQTVAMDTIVKCNEKYTGFRADIFVRLNKLSIYRI